jgi:hypothetical protein
VDLFVYGVPGVKNHPSATERRKQTKGGYP